MGNAERIHAICEFTKDVRGVKSGSVATARAWDRSL